MAHKTLLSIILFCTVYSQECWPRIYEFDSIHVVPSHHSIVTISTVSELNEAILYAQNHSTLLIESGIYDISSLENQRLRSPAYFINDVVIRSQSGNYDDVIIKGSGMYSSNTLNGIEIFYASNLIISSITIRDVYFHCIQIHSGSIYAQNTNITLHNLHLLDAGEQIIKSNPDQGIGVKNLVLIDSIIELTNGWNIHPELGYAYGNGISAHSNENLLIYNCTFKELWYGTSSLAGPAILVWNNAKNTVVDSNIFINCSRGIALGLSGSKHSGGIIKNNFFYRAQVIGNNSAVDAAIYLECVEHTEVIHNTIVLQDTYYAPIEIRYKYTNDTFIANNLLDTGQIMERNGAIAVMENNQIGGVHSFVDVKNGDLHVRNASDVNTFVINRGNLLDNALFDCDGQTRDRNNGNFVDIGADQISNIQCVSIGEPYDETISPLTSTELITSKTMEISTANSGNIQYHLVFVAIFIAVSII